MLKEQMPSTSNNNLLGFVPAIVVDNLMEKIKKKEIRKIPERQTFNSVVMFADISGFTNLSEKLAAKGHEGAELLAFALTRYMEFLVKSIGKSGGDILKFAGDAMIIIWPPPQHNTEEELTTLCRQAIQSSLDIQSKLHEIKLVEDIKLSVKIGFGVGQVTILHVGGVFSRAEYLAAGDPLKEAFECEHLAPGGGYIIISENVHKRVQAYFEFEPIINHHNNNSAHEEASSGGNTQFYYIKRVKRDQMVRMKADALLLNTRIKPSDIEAIRSSLVSYIPAAVLPFIELDEEKWSHELRSLSIMFCNLGIDLADAKTTKGLERIQTVIETVQKCVYKHQGSLNKLLMDDKGSTLMIIFGLYPMAHQDDPVRAVLTGISLVRELKKINCACSVGIATGTVFAGVVGTSGSRREFSVLGDKVNLSARFMQAACKEKDRKILVDETTKSLAECKISFKFAMKQPVKGKTGEISFFQPVDAEEDPEVNSFPYNIRTHKFTPQKSDVVIGAECFDMLGKYAEDSLKNCVSFLEKFFKKPDHNVLFLVTGEYGVGKSLFIRNLLEKTYKLTENLAWKHQETCLVLVNTLDSASKALSFNGWRAVCQQVLIALALRTKTLAESVMFKLLENEPELLNNLNYAAEILGLKLPQKKDAGSLENLKLQEKEQKIVKRVVCRLFQAFLEESQDEDSKFSNSFSNNPSNNNNTNSNNTKNVAAPLLLILEDMQDYDAVSWSLAKKLLKKLKKLVIVASVRDKYCEIPPSFAKRAQDPLLKPRNSGSEGSSNKKFQIDYDSMPIEERLEQWASELEESCDPSGFLRVDLKGLSEEETRLLIRKTLKTNSVTLEPSPEKPENLQENATKAHETAKKVENHHVNSNNNMGNHGNSEEISQRIVEKFIKALTARTEGKAMDILELIENLMSLGYLQTRGKSLVISHKIKKIFEMRQFLTIPPPLSRVSVNGEMLDRLETPAYLLLKAAAVIGEEFDLQMLLKVNPFQSLSSVGHEKVRRVISYLEKSDIIEILDENEHNLNYRFVHPFMREIIYSRMLFSQRRQLHRFVAEAMQSSPLQNEANEKPEAQRLIYHWCLAENLDATEIENSQFSNKAKRSLIVKKISSLLSKNQQSLSIVVKSGVLEKKSDHGMSWSSRFLVLNCKELRYYYSEADFKKNTDFALGVISLKHIFKIFYLDEKETKKKYAFVIYTGSWQKKNKEMGVREFYFSSTDYATLESWTTYLEFLRAKAIYDDFVYSFGKISFPLSLGDRTEEALQKEKGLNMSRMTHALETTRASYKNAGLQRKNTMGASRKMTVMKGVNKQIVLNTMQEVMVSNANQENARKVKERVGRFLMISLKLFFSQIIENANSSNNFVLGQTTQMLRKLPLHIEEFLLEDGRNAALKAGNLSESQELKEPREFLLFKGNYEGFAETNENKVNIDVSQTNSGSNNSKRFSEDSVIMSSTTNNFIVNSLISMNTNNNSANNSGIILNNNGIISENLAFPKSKSNLEMITEVEETRSQSVSLVNNPNSSNTNEETPTNHGKSQGKPSHFAFEDKKNSTKIDAFPTFSKPLDNKGNKHRSTLDDFDKDFELSPTNLANTKRESNKFSDNFANSLQNNAFKDSTQEIIDQIDANPRQISLENLQLPVKLANSSQFLAGSGEKHYDLLSETVVVSKNPHKSRTQGNSSQFAMKFNDFNTAVAELKQRILFEKNEKKLRFEDNFQEKSEDLREPVAKTKEFPLSFAKNPRDSAHSREKSGDFHEENVREDPAESRIPKVLLRKDLKKTKEMGQRNFLDELPFRVFSQEKPKVRKIEENGNPNYGKMNFFKRV